MADNDYQRFYAQTHCMHQKREDTMYLTIPLKLRKAVGLKFGDNVEVILRILPRMGKVDVGNDHLVDYNGSKIE